MLRFLQTIYPSLILHIWQINQWENYFPLKDSSYFPQSSEIKPNILNTVDPPYAMWSGLNHQTQF